MKLFTKTLLFFAGAIVFQSALTILSITSVTKRLNSADAKRELEAESAVLSEKLNAWKRQIWIALNTLGADETLARGNASDAAARLRELASLSKADALVLRHPDLPALLVEGDFGADGGVPAVDALSALRPHPYLDFAFVRDTLCLVGFRTLEADPARRRELYLLKRLDGEFVAQLVLDRDSGAALYLGTRYLAGTLPSPPLRLFEGAPPGIEGTRYSLREGRESYNVSWQRIGSVEGGGDLTLATFLSGAPYLDRLVLLDRAVLASSLAGALLTILLSLFLSRNITSPFAHLLEGMSQLRSGAWDTRVRLHGGHEIRELFHAFNEMARELERHRAALAESLAETTLLKEYNETIVNSIQAGIAIVSQGLVVERANACFDASLEIASSAGRHLSELGVDVFDGSVAAAVRNVISSGTAWSALKRSSNGRVFELKLYPFAGTSGEAHVRCVLVTEDITARTELEEKIFRAEKLASVGLLSAGMAHEINNPLGSILANVQNLIDEERDPSRQVSLRWIEKESHRIARVVRELLRFASSSDVQQPGGTDVNSVAAEVVRMVGHTLAAGDRIRIVLHLEPGLPAAEPSEDEVTQLLLNLLTNSAQAIPGSGRIVITTRLSDCGKLIHLSVADTGAGIAPENLRRVFDPFFTTKPNGEGTGLGLSVVYGIVAKYNGTVRVRSTVGRGTGMRLGLPVRGA